MPSEERQAKSASPELRSEIQIPTGFMEGSQEFVDRDKERAILLARIHDLANGEQLRKRFKYFLWGIPAIFASFFVLVASFLIPTLLGEVNEYPEVTVGIFLSWCALAILLILKGFTTVLTPVSLKKVYLTYHIMPYSSEGTSHSSLIFDANSIQDVTELKYDEIDAGKISNISKLQSTIDNLDHTFENERLVVMRLSEIDNIVESQTSINIKSRTVEADSFVINGINSMINLCVPGSPVVELGSLDFDSDAAQAQVLEIRALEERGASLAQLNRINDKVGKVRDEFADPLTHEIAEVETFGSVVHDTQRDRWAVANVEENVPEFDYQEYGFIIGRYNANASASSKNQYVDTLLSIPHKIVSILQRKSMREIADLEAIHQRDVLMLEGETARTIAEAKERADKAIHGFLQKAETHGRSMETAQDAYQQAQLRIQQASGFPGGTATERARRTSAINSARTRSDRAETKYQDAAAKFDEARNNAATGQERIKEVTETIQTAVEKQIAGTTESLGTQLRSKMVGTERIINARDRQLDLAMSFLTRSLPDEFASHARPFVLRREQLLEPASKIQGELSSRIDDLNQVLGHIHNLKTGIAIDRPVEMHIPFWIVNLSGRYDNHVHVFTPSQIKSRGYVPSNWLKEKMGATQYLDNIQPISRALIPMALSLLARSDNTTLLQESIQIPFAPEDSGILAGQLDELVRDGLITERYATRVATFWGSKSVGPNDKKLSKTLTETTFVDSQEQYN
jgi:hypothetical protein